MLLGEGLFAGPYKYPSLPRPQERASGTISSCEGLNHRGAVAISSPSSPLQGPASSTPVNLRTALPPRPPTHTQTFTPPGAKAWE